MMLPDFLYRQGVRQVLAALCILAVTVNGIRVVAWLKPVYRDFDMHRDLGRFFLTGQDRKSVV